MLETTLALVIFLLPLAYSPGPGNMFFAAIGARFGFLATLRANAGYHLATWVVTFVIGFGFIAAMELLPQVFVILKISGAIYVLWLAWKLFRAPVLQSQGTARPAGFIDGAILLLLNPKAYVIIALMFTQFLEVSGNIRAIIMITSVFTLNNLVAFALWSAVGEAISRQFRTDVSARRLNIIFSLMLAGVAIWMLVS